MADKPVSTDGKVSAPDSAVTPPVPPKRGPGHRGADVKDTVAEMAAKAHEISLEAGSKMAAAMKDVINAAAGLTGFVLESARDLVQYMVRRGQMTQEEADKLIRQAEEAQAGRPKPAADKAPKAEKVVAPASADEEEAEEEEDDDDADKKTAAKSATKTAAKKAPAEKSAEKVSAAAKKAPAKKK
jgi:polyhydroxyalkanoate synthesis regulator phasin